MSLPRSYPFTFTGNGGEYFRIWIVNIALTLVTLGIYSAWAKVRTQRWFYGHTILDNTAFSYLATPIQILKGRLIAAALLIIYYIASHTAPLIAGIIMLAIMIGSPWIIVLALRFAARQSSYRGLRLNFSGTVGEAAVVYLFLPITTIFTLGLSLPFVAYRQVRFLASNYGYGETQSEYDGSLKPFWGVYLLALALLLIPMGILGYAVYSAAQLTAMGLPKEIVTTAVASTAITGVIALYVTIPILSAFVQARKANLFYNHIALGNIRFRSTQRSRDMIWIYLSNIVLIFITVGLFIPFAKVRLARYRAEHLTLLAEDLGVFTTQAQEAVSATGSEISDLFDFDIGIA
ncbi:YjgN family protein [Sulfuricurvum sp.]|uniref:YjgN family protein n=1 Tax=Sulfuricurvum sp. TaxID=2025608 RepID=UPI00261394A1|nr:YjgN family protein [Sulfuricurvum sp.]MDD3597550.1 YjgN family protein [Sulfuricurvum sp.]